MIDLKNFSIIFSFILLILNICDVNGKTCFSCEGINCLRTSYNKTEICNDPLDLCVTIFKDFTIERKGCYVSTSEELRSKCVKKDNLECDICEGDLCNKYGRKDFVCIECDTSKDKNCDENPSALKPVRCPAPASINSYCYIERANGKITKRGCSTETNHQKKCYTSKDSSCNLCIPTTEKICNAPEWKAAAPVPVPTGPVSSAAELQKISFLGIIGIGYLIIKGFF